MCVYVQYLPTKIYMSKKYKKREKFLAPLTEYMGGGFPGVSKEYLLYILRKILSYCITR